MRRIRDALAPSAAVMFGLLVLGGCGDDTSSSTESTSSAGGEGGSGGDGSGAGDTGGGSDTGGAGGGLPSVCAERAPGPTRGSAIALTPDDALLVVANRDAGSVTIFDASYDAGLPTLERRVELATGAETWEVAIDGCGERAYAISRREQRLVVIDDLRTTPTITASIAIGSEPTGLAVSPNNTRVYVTSWIDGTLQVVDAASLSIVDMIDLNPVLADTGFLGPSVSASSARPSLAHPRSIAITNDGDGDDDDETVVVTEFFAQRTAPEANDGSNVDENWVGLLYRVDASDGSVAISELGSVADVGFTGAAGTGCWVNQLQSVSIRDQRAYVTSICASPKGPTNPKQMTHPTISVVDLESGLELPASPAVLDGAMVAHYEATGTPDDASRRVPLLASEMAIDATSGEVLVVAQGVDAVFRFGIDTTTGEVDGVGHGAGRPFVDLSSTALPEPARGVAPIGIALAHGEPVAFTSNDITRNVSALSISATDAGIAGGPSDPRVYASTPAPSSAQELSALRGKQAFNTGLGRYSLLGQGWGSCASCHFEGLSDNVTWYFARGPRQSTSLDGSFASGDPSDQRIFNWTAVADEIADFEAVLRGLDGGVGAIVHSESDPPTNADRIDLAATPLFPLYGAAGLNGAAALVVEQASVVKAWQDIEAYVQAVRSPRAPTNLDGTAVQAGAALFAGAGGCAGCHGGAKWTLSTRFYEPSEVTNAALKTTTYDGAALVAAGFPAALLPAPASSQVMRSGAGAGDVVQCLLRPVGTYGVSPADVNAIEVTQNMSSPALGDEAVGKGYNVPSLLGMQVGAPYLHAGNARTLEELFDALFVGHHGALADAGFLQGAGAVAARDALVQYLLSIDESTAAMALPSSAGAQGGDFCQAP